MDAHDAVNNERAQNLARGYCSDCSGRLCEHGVCKDPECAGGECLECSFEAEEGE